MAFEQTFKQIDDILHKDPGCSNALDYVEQTSWLLFLKYLDDLDRSRADGAELAGQAYTPLLQPEYSWRQWAAPLNDKGEPNHNKALTGNELMQFVKERLFPYLQSFKENAPKVDSIEYKIGEVFGGLRCKIESGYNLREVLWKIDLLHFQSSDAKHEMSALYENRLNQMGNAGRNGGEYYTPRPLIRSIVRCIAPKIGETVYDAACGSAGFLCEAFAYMNAKAKSIKDKEKLQKSTFYGQEVKQLAYIIAIMNMIFHGVDAPHIVRGNTLQRRLTDIQPREQKSVILANPPFGAKERQEVQTNFPIKTGETAYLFLQHFIKMLKPGGRAGIVIKNTFLSNADNASVALRRSLLEECNLHTVLNLPGGVFQAGVKTVVLFFEKGKPTERVWYYDLNLGRNLGKTNPLNEQDLEEFERLYKKKPEGENSWSVAVADLNPDTLDLSVRNPHRKEEVTYRSPREIVAEMRSMMQQSLRILDEMELDA